MLRRDPNEADPTYQSWKLALKRELAALRQGAIVVGHSVGGTILVNLLADETPPVGLGAIVLIAAPFIGTGGWPSDFIFARIWCVRPGSSRQRNNVACTKLRSTS